MADITRIPTNWSRLQRGLYDWSVLEVVAEAVLLEIESDLKELFPRAGDFCTLKAGIISYDFNYYFTQLITIHILLGQFLRDVFCYSLAPPDLEFYLSYMTTRGSVPNTPDARKTQSRITSRLSRQVKKVGCFLYGHAEMDKYIKRRVSGGLGRPRATGRPQEVDDVSALTEAFDVLQVREEFDIDDEDEEPVVVADVVVPRRERKIRLIIENPDEDLDDLDVDDAVADDNADVDVVSHAVDHPHAIGVFPRRRLDIEIESLFDTLDDVDSKESSQEDDFEVADIPQGVVDVILQQRASYPLPTSGFSSDDDDGDSTHDSRDDDIESNNVVYYSGEPEHEENGEHSVAPVPLPRPSLEPVPLPRPSLGVYGGRNERLRFASKMNFTVQDLFRTPPRFVEMLIGM